MILFKMLFSLLQSKPDFLSYIYVKKKADLSTQMIFVEKKANRSNKTCIPTGLTNETMLSELQNKINLCYFW